MTLNPAVQVILSGCLSFGIPLLIALFELRSLRRYRPRGGGWRPAAPPPQPRPLPPCLIPTEQWRAPTRVRELA